MSLVAADGRSFLSLRPAYPRSWSFRLPHFSRNEETYQFTGYPDRGPGYQKRGRTVQSAGDRAGCFRGRRRIDPRWVEREITEYRGGWKTSTLRISFF